jgi:3-hydroxyacyl-[acyl-carrier-protein] dehydratase
VNDQSTSAAMGPLDVRRVMAALPHRYPMLLVDRIENLDPDKGIVAIKAVTINEPFFQGHFPGRPIMPGVLIVEALAQTGAVAVLSEEENRGKLAFFAGIDDCRFKRVVSPGDVLELRCELERMRGPIGRGKAEARVDGELACRATLTFAVER